MEDYKNATHFKTVYLPDVPEIYDAEHPWLAWEAIAAEKPGVVNISVSSKRSTNKK